MNKLLEILKCIFIGNRPTKYGCEIGKYLKGDSNE